MDFFFSVNSVGNPLRANVYPVAKEKFKWEVRDEFDASDSKYDLETDAGTKQLWDDITNLMPSHCTANPKGEGCYDLIIAFVSDRSGTYPEGRTQGFTYGKPTNIVVAKDEDAPATVAHEIAHTYGIGDTYNGGSFRCSVNPAPASFTGKDGDNREQNVQCTAQGREPLGEISATKIPEDQHPYEVDGRGALKDMACYMGSGGQQAQFWTTQEAYNHLFTQLAPSVAKRATRESPVRVLAFQGFIKADGTVEEPLDPWESFMDDTVHTDTTGVYMIRAVDAGGNTVATQKLDVQFNILSTPPDPIKTLEWAPFEGVIPFPENVKKFEIVKDDVVKATKTVSANAPTVSSVKPATAGETVSGQYSITWNAEDKDGDSLSYTVEYNSDVVGAPNNWMILDSEIEEKKWDEDFSSLSGGDNAEIRVTATDGILTAVAESAVFKVPFKKPEVFIQEPEWGTSYEVGDEIMLEADVYDVQDEWLANDKLVWTSSISGQIGKGTNLVKELSAGEHVITLTGTNSKGLSSTDSLTVFVGNVTTEYIAEGDEEPVVLTNTFNNATTSVTVPAGLVTADTELSYTYLKEPSASTLPAFAYKGRYFSLSAEAEQSADNWVEVSDLKVTVKLENLNLPAGVSLGSLKLLRWDGTAWTDSGATYDTAVDGILGATVSKMGEYALVGVEKLIPGLEAAIRVLKILTEIPDTSASDLNFAGGPGIGLEDAVFILQSVAEQQQ